MDQEWKNLGEQILDSVSGALNSGDFSKLNDLVSGTVETVVKEAKRQADIEKLSRMQDAETIEKYFRGNAQTNEKWQEQQREIFRQQMERREEWKRARQEQIKAIKEKAVQRAQQAEAELRQSGAAASGQAQVKTQKNRKNTAPPVKFVAIGSVANVLNTIFGSLGLGIMGAAMLLSLIFRGPIGLVISTLGLLGSIAMLVAGSKQRKLLRRAQRYIKLCGEKKYCDIEELAMQTGNSVKFVKKDLKKMIRKGMFPEGHLDMQETCFMLSDEVYHQYTETAHAYKMREQMEAEKRNRPLTPEEEAQKAVDEQTAELNAMMSEGMQYIKKLRELNDVIPGQEISEQLSQMESLLHQIFDRVKEHPEQMHRMHKLMEYYLPTTVKLVEAYVQFEKVETPGQDIKSAKAEILKTLGIINEAFAELLNNLFQDEVFDATTDAQVLQTMLSREGLRREMSAEPVATHAAEEEEEAFAFGMEPEQSEEPSVLKAPWES